MMAATPPGDAAASLGLPPLPGEAPQVGTAPI